MGWRPTEGDHVLITLHRGGPAGRYVVRGSSGDRLIVVEVWCQNARLQVGRSPREIRWADIRDLRPAPEPDC